MNYTYWRQYFESNQSHFKNINWDEPDSLTVEEKSTITKSIQQFQEGENSEGKHLFQYAKTINDPEYLSATGLFIKEEQNHARVLARFMEKYEIKKANGHWVDRVFRWLRKQMGLENSIIVLVTAEIIAKVYYDALRNATNSGLLKKICNQVLKDEEEHITFQCYTLNRLYEKRNFFSRFISRSWHLFLMTGTILVVWWHHKKVLRKGAYYFSRFFLQTMLVFLNADEMIKNKNTKSGQPLSAVLR
jgi:rubrerythrin